jgi:DNA polymerase-1
MKKIYLIDGMSLVFRAYHALSKANFKSPVGEPTGALFGFTNIITNFLEKENPEYIAVAFDTREPTFRHVQFENYKSNRPEFPEELVPQLPKIKQLLDYLGINRIELPGYEADDIIGTLSNELGKDDTFVYCVTSDKDYMQLINDNVFILRPSANQGEDFNLISYDEVKSKFGVTPDKVIDVLALTGDSVDNVPGVKGIGEKTAIPLIQQFGSLENLYNNLDKIEKISVREKLAVEKENAFLSKELVTLDLNVPIDLQIESLRKKPVSFKDLDQFFKEAGFTKIRTHWFNKALAESNNISDSPSISDISENQETQKAVSFQIIENFSLAEQIIDSLKKETIFFFEFIFDSFDRQQAKPVGISTYTEKSGYNFFLFNNLSDNKNIIQQNLFSSNEIKSENQNILELFKPLLENQAIAKVSNEIKFQSFILKNYGININTDFFDISIASYILNPDDKHELEAIYRKYCNSDFSSYTTLHSNFTSQKINLKQIFEEDRDKFISYLIARIASISELYKILTSELDKNEQTKLANEIEFPLISVLTSMEYSGVRIDISSLLDISKTMGLEIDNLLKLIYSEAGTEFNVDSPKQLSQILFEDLKLPIIKKTKTGLSTDMGVLTELLGSHPIIEYLIDYRQLTKLKSTYIDALPKLVNPRTNKIHTTYNQIVTATGRLSSTDPNLQNIPIRTEKGKEIRKAFIPSNQDNLILSADYSQIELRIMAYYSKDKSLIEAFQQNIDIHTATASKLFNVPLEKVDSDMRRIAKTVNFGIMYGLGAFGLAQRLKIARNRSSQIIENYFDKYPGIKNYIEDTIAITRKKGYAETLMGRRRYFPEINSKNRNIQAATERAAINMPIQGTASDMIKIAMINIFYEFQKYQIKSKMILQVHDEIVIDLFKQEEEIVRNILTTKMENALKLENIPIKIEIGVGKNWLEAH